MTPEAWLLFVGHPRYGCTASSDVLARRSCHAPVAVEHAVHEMVREATDQSVHPSFCCGLCDMFLRAKSDVDPGR